MTLHKVLLGTTALVGAGMIMAGSPKAADLDVDVAAALKFGAVFGDIETSLGTSNLREYDFFTDNEIHFKAEATDDQTGITYGGTVELEADTNTGLQNATADTLTGAVNFSANDNIDESFIFLRGGFGELQLGDQDSASDQLKVGAYSIAAGTGGIDGNGAVTTVPITIPNTGDATKITYLAPTEQLFGFTAGVSFTPDGGDRGQSIAINNNGSLENALEGGVQYALSAAGFDVKVGATGILADIEDGDELTGWQVGASTGVFGFQVAGSYFTSERDPGAEVDGWNIGLGGTFGPADASVNYGTADVDGEDAETLVFSASVGMLPGVTLQGDVGLFSDDSEELELDDLDDEGIAGVVRLDVNF